jgi:WD40 repeat protein
MALHGPAGPQAALHELLGERQLWWKCCSEAFRADPTWLFDGRGEERRAWLDETAPDRPADSLTPAEHAWLLSRTLSAPQDPDGGHEKVLAPLAETWRRSGLLSEAATTGPTLPSGHSLDRLSPRVAGGLRSVVERIQDLHGPVESNAPRSMLVIAALLMAGVEPRRRPVVRVPVVFGRSAGPTGQAAPDGGVTGILELREFPSGPTGLYPDPRTMAGVRSPNQQFAESLGHAWNAAGPRREGRCVLWRLVLSDEHVPPARIEGPSLGAAFALGLRDLVRYPPSRRPSVAWIRGVFYGLRPRTAVTGALDADERLLRVAGMDAKLVAAYRKGFRLVAPEANRLDVAAAPESGDVKFAANLRQADRYARRLRLGRLAVAVVVLIAFATGGFALQQQGSVRSEQQAALVSRITAEADQLRSADPSLAAQLDRVAYGVKPTADLYSHLMVDANSPLSTVLNDYSNSVDSVAFSPDGRILAAAGYDGEDNGTVRLWNMTNPAHPVLLGPPLQHLGGVSTVAFSPDGRTLVTGGLSTRDNVRLWNVTDPAHPTALGKPLPDTPNGGILAFSPDGRTLVTGDDNVRDVLLWNVKNPAHPVQVGQPLRQTAAVNAVVFSPDGHTLATEDGATVLLRNVADPTHAVPLGQIQTGHSGGVSSVAFSPDGRTLATGGYDDDTRLWNMANPTHAVMLGTPLTGHTGAISSAAFSPDGRTLATASTDHTVRLWNVTNPAKATLLAHPLAGHTATVSSLAFSPDGRTLVTSSDDHTMRLWNLPTALLTGHTDTVISTVFRPDGRVLATASEDDTVRLWDVADPAHPTALSLFRGFTDIVESLAFSSDGHTLATAVDGEHRVVLWNVTNPVRPKLLTQLVNFPSDVSSVAFSPTGHTLATATSTGVVGGDNSVRLWDVSDPAHPTLLGHALPTPLSAANSVMFSADGHTLAISGGYSSGTVRLWDVTDPSHPTALGHPLAGAGRSMAFSPDGRTLAITAFAAYAGEADDGTVRLWNVSDRAHPTPLGQPLGSSTNPIRAVAFSPDGRTLAAAGTGVQLWNVTDPAHPATIGQPLDVYPDEVSSIAFAPDDHTLATGSYDDTARLWQLGADKAIQQICASTDTPTRQQWQQYLSELPYRSSCG